MDANTTGASNVGVGKNSLGANTTASNNTAVGHQSLAANTTGGSNVAVGSTALAANTTGASGTAVGRFALEANTTGNHNTAVGQSALEASTTGSNNTAVGLSAGGANTTGYQNAFFGQSAGAAITTGALNSFFGQGSGDNITTGSNNTILGRYNGNQNSLDIRTSSNHIVLSDGAGVPRVIVDSSGNALIGKTALGTANTGVEIGGSGASGGGFLSVTRNNAGVLFVNRGDSDGTVVNIMQANNSEGSISVSGSTVSYNGGHLARWSQATDGNRIDGLLKGTVMTNLDQMAEWTKDDVTEDNEQLNCMAVSSVEGDPNVAGVFVNWDDDDEDYTADMNVAMTGDMIIALHKAQLSHGVTC